MNIHSLKHNAKASAKRICARFSGIEVVEPVKAMPQPGADQNGWYASVRVVDGVLPSSIAPEVLEAAHVELPDGWMLYNGNSIQRIADVRGIDTSAHANIEAGDPVPFPNDLAGSEDPVEIALSAVKDGSKESGVFALLRREEGATVAEIAVVMGWLAHTTRAYISVRTRKRGLEAVTEKVDGRGTVYRVRIPAQQAA